MYSKEHDSKKRERNVEVKTARCWCVLRCCRTKKPRVLPGDGKFSVTGIFEEIPAVMLVMNVLWTLFLIYIR